MGRESFVNRDKRHGTPSHRRAPNMEKSLAKRTGGRITPGSGNKHVKGDIQKAFGVFRIEAKCTKNRSFSVTREMIRKIEEAGDLCGEVGVIVIEFLNEQGKPEMEVAVVPTHALPKIAEENDYGPS